MTDFRHSCTTFLLVGLAFALSLAHFACSPMTRYKVLSFFFDGVPNPSEVALVDTSAVADRAALEERLRRLRMGPQYVFHPPYQDKDCGSCHDIQAGNRLLAPQPDLCYGCHDDFRESFEVLHGPVAGGYCTACHNPHMAKNENLLFAKGQALCLFCHEKTDVFANPVHSDIGEADCTECHNPHGGDDRTFLQ